MRRSTGLDKLWIMMNQGSNIALVEIEKKDAYLREIGSKYSTSHYYDVSVCRESESWRIELTRKALNKGLDKNYHGRLFEDHIQEPRAFAVVMGNREVGWIELGYDRWNSRMRVWEFLVEEEFRKRGVGTLLMNHAVEIAKAKGRGCWCLRRRQTMLPPSVST
jgi:GNAT superfamily N-acetyltransferase